MFTWYLSRVSCIIIRDGRNVQIFYVTASRGQSQLLTLSAAEIRLLVRLSYLARARIFKNIQNSFLSEQSINHYIFLSNKSTMSKRLKSVSFMMSWFKSQRIFANIHNSLTRVTYCPRCHARVIFLIISLWKLPAARKSLRAGFETLQKQFIRKVIRTTSEDA